MYWVLYDELSVIWGIEFNTFYGHAGIIFRDSSLTKSWSFIGCRHGFLCLRWTFLSRLFKMNPVCLLDRQLNLPDHQGPSFSHFLSYLKCRREILPQWTIVQPLQVVYYRSSGTREWQGSLSRFIGVKGSSTLIFGTTNWLGLNFGVLISLDSAQLRFTPAYSMDGSTIS